MSILVEQNEGAALRPPTATRATQSTCGTRADCTIPARGLGDSAWGVWQRHEDQPGEGHGKSYKVSLYAGQMYRAGIYSPKRGPTSARPESLSHGMGHGDVFPEPTPLIKTRHRFGGTFAHPYVKRPNPRKQ